MVGITLMTKFVQPGTKAFRTYVDYIDRETAVRNNAYKNYSDFQGYKDYSDFTDYMDNVEKSPIVYSDQLTAEEDTFHKRNSYRDATELFTANSDKLSISEKESLKEAFSIAQDNGSLMWQTVISFDNRWLTKNGLFDPMTNSLNVKRLQEYTRGSMAELLGKENLNNALWSAAVHYNTDNLHIHIATVEVAPTRDRGVFKEKNIKTAKSTFTNMVLSHSLENEKVNNIINKNILQNTRLELSNPSSMDLYNSLVQLRDVLPKDRRLWKYGTNAMNKYRDRIDNISKSVVNQHFSSDIKELHALLKLQQDKYSEAYGGDPTENKFANNKIKTLYDSLGNSVLKICKTIDSIDPPGDISQQSHTCPQNLPSSPPPAAPPSFSFSDENRQNQFKEFYYKNKKSEAVKTAMELLRENKMTDACFTLEAEAKNGNICAAEKLADIYALGKNLIDNEKETSDVLYAFALNGYNTLSQSANPSSSYFSFLNYKIGAYYYKGKGMDPNYVVAAKHFNLAGDNGYAQYSLGKMYADGLGVEKNGLKAFTYFKLAADNSCNAYASYEVAQKYANGIDVKKDLQLADYYYKMTLNTLIADEKRNPDKYTELKLGQMYAKGLGLQDNQKDIPKAIEMLEKAIAAGEENAYFPLAKIYLNEPEWGRPDLAVKYLKKASAKGNKYASYTLANVYLNEEADAYNPALGKELLLQVAEKGLPQAQYKLGNIYYNSNASENPDFDEGKAIYWYTRAAENDNVFAQYKLGKIYYTNGDERKAESWFTLAAQKDNEFAQHSLGKLYLDGKDLKNYKKAEAWLNRAADNGNVYSMMQLGYMNLKANHLDYGKAADYFMRAHDAGHPDAMRALGQLKLKKSKKTNKRLQAPKVSLAALKKLFKEDLVSAKNQAAYSRLQEEIEMERN